MYYIEKTATNKVKSRRVHVKDFSSGMDALTSEKVTPLYRAHCSHNFSFKSGSLRDGKGIGYAIFTGADGERRLCNPDFTPEAVYYFKKYDAAAGKHADIICCFNNDGYVYAATAGEDVPYQRVEDLCFDSVPQCISYNYGGKDVLIFSDGSAMKIYDGESVKEVENAPCIRSMCVCNERIFACEWGEKSTLWFSDNFNPENWAVSLHEAGYIDLKDGKGAILKVVSMGGYVYAFRSYGISRITAYGDQTEFSVESVADMSGKIFGGSVTVCADRIVFLAEDGLYIFNGSSVAKLVNGLEKHICKCQNDNAGIFYGGELYLNMELDLFGRRETVLFVYDKASGTYYFNRGLEIKCMAFFNGETSSKLLAVSRLVNSCIGEVCDKAQVFGIALNKVWQSGESELGISGVEKILKKLTFYSSGDIAIEVESDKEKIKTVVKGSKSLITLPLRMRGSWFKVEISSRMPGSDISALCLHYDYQR